MPPRKKTKLSSRAPSSPSVGTPKETTPAAVSIVSQEATRPVLDPDPWTDNQEAVLFKNLVRYKPVGLHRHTRMFCILTNLRRYGWREDHISRRGVWQKLDTLYNMESLHEREDADELEREDEWIEFWLPPLDFEEDMFSRRINTKRSSSPPTLYHQLSHRNGADTRKRSSADDGKASLSEVQKSSPEPEWESSRDTERRRSLRGRGGRGGRGASHTQSETMTRKRKRAETPPPNQEEENEEGEGSGEEEVEEDEEGSDDGDDDGEEGDGEDDEDEDGEEEDDGEEGENNNEGEDEDNEESEAEEQPAAPVSRGGRGRPARNVPQRGRPGTRASASGKRRGGASTGGGKTRGGRGARAARGGRTARGGRGRGR